MHPLIPAQPEPNVSLTRVYLSPLRVLLHNFTCVQKLILFYVTIQPLPQDNFYQERHPSYNNPQYGHQSIMQPGAPLHSKQLEQTLPPAQSEMPARTIEPEKPKAPIPEQHMHLKTILDELRDQCYEHAKNPVNI